MNTDAHRWNLTVSALIVAATASVTHDSIAADGKFQLEKEIDRRFSVAEKIAEPDRIIDSAFRLTRTLRRSFPNPIILDFNYPQAERVKDCERDDSYHLAKDYQSYRGVAMLFEDERSLVGGRTFYR